MATVERNPGTEEQKEQVSPSEDSPPVLNDTTASLNFSEIKPCQFGISAKSFTPTPLSKSKDKSRLAQIKARRRSSIGVRGSPETNSLIRFMAQQRMKTQSALQTPELVRSSPAFPRVTSTLKQKMASFQNLMDVEVCREVCDAVPRQDSSTGGCIKTRDYLSDGNIYDGEKENHPSLMTPTMSKRRRLGPPETCDFEIREAPVLPWSLKEQTDDEELVTQAVTQRPVPSSEAQAVLVSPPLYVDFELQAGSPPDSQQEAVFELQSPSQPPPDDPAAASPAQPPSFLCIPTFPSQLEMLPTGEDAFTVKSAVKSKKKTVRFGGPLSPEFFDKNLPPSTPLQKGGTPARAHTPGGSLMLRSVLKTPQRSDSQTPQGQPGLSSPTEFDASPVLKMPRNRRMQPVGEDREELDGKIVFPSIEQIDSELAHDAECTLDAQPLNLNSAFHEESLSQVLAETETEPSTASQMDEPTPFPEQVEQQEVQAKPRHQRKKQPAAECESTSKSPARSSSRKRKQPEESEPVKRSTRSAAKSASGKIKKTSTATRRWNKDVDRSLYSLRAYASKNPTLSPIKETFSFLGLSPAAQQTPSMSCAGPDPENNLNPEMNADIQTPGDPAVTNTSENPSENSITFSVSNKGSTTGKDSRGSGQVSEEIMVKDCEDRPTANLEAVKETALTQSPPEHGGADSIINAQVSLDGLCTDSDGKSECHVSLDVPMSECPPSGSNGSLRLPARRKAKRGRRSATHSSALQEQRNQAEEHQTSREVEEKEQGEQQENILSGSDGQEERAAASSDLAPWQADFNIEDVFKPVAARQQRSVRRSLRNQHNAENSRGGGLAWLPRTSPDSSSRTRGRRLSAAPPEQLSGPENPHHGSS